MLIAVVLEAEVQARELQRGGAAQVVEPLDFGVAHDDLALAEDPVGELAVALLVRVDQHAGNRDPALRVAPYHELEVIHFKRVQAQVEEKERAPGDDIHDAWQRQRFAPPGIEQPHVDQFQLRAQSTPVGADPLHRYLQPDGFRDRSDNLWAVLLDIGQDPVAQDEEQRCREEEQRPEEHFRGTQEDPARAQGTPDARRPARWLAALRNSARFAASQCAASLAAVRVCVRLRLHGAARCPYSCKSILTVNTRSD